MKLYEVTINPDGCTEFIWVKEINGKKYSELYMTCQDMADIDDDTLASAIQEIIDCFEKFESDLKTKKVR